MKKMKYITAVSCIVIGSIAGFIYAKKYSEAHFADQDEPVAVQETPTEAWRRLGVGSFSSNNVNTVVWYGDAGAHYCIERSMDLRNWDIIEAMYPEGGCTGGRVAYEEQVTHSSRVYYRINKVPAGQTVAKR